MDVKVCRICLNTDVRMYSYCKKSIRELYLKVLDFKIHDDTIFPQYICYECMSLLMKFIKFRQKCLRGLQILEQLKKNGKITENSIKSINRRNNKLISSYSIYHNDRIEIQKETLNIEKNNIKNEIVCYDGIIKSENKINNGDSYNEYENTEDNKDFVFVEINVNSMQSMNSKKPVQNGCQAEVSTDTDQKQKASSSPEKSSVKQHREKAVNDTKEKQNKDKSYVKNSVLLDKEKWTVTKLTDEEAFKVFQGKAESSKYLNSPSKCELCYTGFSNHQILSRHKFISHNEKYKEECNMCKVRRKIPCHLNTHMRSHYFVYKCQICEFTTMNSAGACYHNAIHENAVRTCQFCGDVFKHISTYNSHLRLQHPSQHLCRICGKSFLSALGVHRHIRVSHLEIGRESKETNMSQKNVEVYCDLCEISFQTKEAYDKHMLHSAKHKESDVFLKPTAGCRKRRYRSKYSDTESGGIITKVKKKIKVTKEKITKEKVKHAKEVPCVVCNVMFKSFKRVHEHHLKEHVGIPFDMQDRGICEVCGAYIRIYNLQIHMNTHTHERMHPCKLCTREFTSHAAVVRHMASHTGEKNFKCNLCDKQYTQSESLTLHVNTIHLKKPYPKRNRWKNKLKITGMQNPERESDDS